MFFSRTRKGKIAYIKSKAPTVNSCNVESIFPSTSNSTRNAMHSVQGFEANRPLGASKIGSGTLTSTLWLSFLLGLMHACLDTYLSSKVSIYVIQVSHIA